jgi:integrase
LIYCAIIAFFLCFVFIFYISRHSWASIAQDRKVSTDIIREGLGHDNEKTTHIYLASISTSQIDRANQIILKGL